MIVSDDIYMTAYLALTGLSITDIKIIPNSGGRKVEFVLAGENEEQKANDFKNEKANVNIKKYLYKLFELRNTMYSLKDASKTTGEPHAKNRYRKNQIHS